MQIIPELDADLDHGRLSLTIAAQAMSCFRKEDLRRKAVGETPLTEEEHKVVLADLMSASTREADRKLVSHFPNQPQSEKAKPVSATSTRIEFNVDYAAMKKFERLMAYHFHKTGGSWAKLFEILADHEIAKLDTPPRRAPGSEQTARTRYVRKHVQQQVWTHWERGCDHILASGERCGSRQNLQKDHLVEFSEGGSNTEENLRLLCAAHNRYRSDRLENLRQQCVSEIDGLREHCLSELYLEAIHSSGVVIQLFSQ